MNLRILSIVFGIAIAAFTSYKDAEIEAIQESLLRANKGIADITEKIKAIEDEPSEEQKGEIWQQELSFDKKAKDEQLSKLKHQKSIQEGLARHYKQLLMEKS